MKVPRYRSFDLHLEYVTTGDAAKLEAEIERLQSKLMKASGNLWFATVTVNHTEHVKAEKLAVEYYRELSACPPDTTLSHWLGVLVRCWKEQAEKQPDKPAACVRCHGTGRVVLTIAGFTAEGECSLCKYK